MSLFAPGSGVNTINGRPRVLVTDAEEKAALATTRGLHRAGWLVTACASGPYAAAHWSRACDRRVSVPNPLTEPAAFAARLHDIVTAGHYEVLIPTVESSVRAISAHRELLEPHVRTGLPPRAALQIALDKSELQRVAAKVGVPPPPSLVCANPVEVHSAAERLGLPVILKTQQSVTYSAGGAQQFGPLVVREQAELAAALTRYPTPLVVQRFEPQRPLISFAGVVADRRLRAIAVSRYARTWPPLAGGASFSETITPPAGLVEKAEQLLAELRWEGIFELELLAGEGGNFSAIDFNPRPYGSMALAIRAGANLPAIWADWLLGRDRATAVARSGFRYRWDEAELLNAGLLARSGRIGAALAVLRPRRHTTHAFFELADPAPLAARGLALNASRRRRRRSRVGPRPDLKPPPLQVQSEEPL